MPCCRTNSTRSSGPRSRSRTSVARGLNCALRNNRTKNVHFWQALGWSPATLIKCCWYCSTHWSTEEFGTMLFIAPGWKLPLAPQLLCGHIVLKNPAKRAASPACPHKTHVHISATIRNSRVKKWQECRDTLPAVIPVEVGPGNNPLPSTIVPQTRRVEGCIRILKRR